MNRGSSIPMPRSHGPMCSFNEAPIHESGKYRMLDELNSDILRFNEAPIHESGKYLVHGRIASKELASMRPRFMNRGSWETARKVLDGNQLQ